MTTTSPTRLLRPTPLRVATVTLCLMLGGCSVLGDWFSGDRTDYKGASKRTQPLEVPPDLTQIQRDSRYLPQSGVIAASDLSKTGGTAAPATASAGAAPAAVVGTAPAAAVAPITPEVSLVAAGNLHIEHQGERRWLATTDAPELVLPKVREYWLAQGFAIKVDEPKTGLIETDWAQSKTRLPGGMITNLFNSVLNNLGDSGLRDRYRTLLQRRADGGTEISVTHFGASEELVGAQKSDTQWVPRPSDPGLEAQQLSQMMLALAGVANKNVAGDAPVGAAAPVTVAQTADGKPAIPSAAIGTPSTVGTGPNGAMRARLVAGQPGATLQVDDNFDRSWRRIGLALDHGGFTVEDRDRAQGLYYVRYVDAQEAAKDEPGFLSKVMGWFGKEGPSPVNKYRIAIKAPGDTAIVTVLNDQGQPDNSDNAKHIVSLLVEELK